MMARIAVEGSLQNVREVLQQNGYDVVALEGGNVPDCDCCVISGQDENVMGISDRATEVSVINAHGLTGDQILQEVNRRTQA
jgi:hypothetical protein